jgi:hypothetical protein
MKDLYSKVLPPIKNVEDRIAGFFKDHEVMKALVSRFDEVLSGKASKMSI